MENMRSISMSLSMCHSLVYVGERPFDIGVVTPFANMAQYAEEAAKIMKINACIAVSDFDNDHDVAMELIQKEKLNLFATRGYAVHLLRNRFSIPILSFSYSSENFFETLLPYQNTGIRIGHLCFPEQGEKFLRIAHMLGIEGYRLEVDDRENLDSVLEQAREKNIVLLTGGYRMMMNARDKGFDTLPLVSEYRDEVFNTMAEAKYIITMNSVHAHRQVFVNTVLNINPNIIVVVDKESVIHYVNDSAVQTFSHIRRELNGLSLKEIFMEDRLEQLFSAYDDARALPVMLTDVTHRKFQVKVAKITLAAGFDGYVLSLSEEEGHRSERRTRPGDTRKKRTSLYSFDDIAGKSDSLQKVKTLGMQFALSDAPVCLIGDSGTGKEMFAQAIHAKSGRRTFPFLSINCASIPEQLLESELFGYEEGAFTGTRRGGKRGIFELAHGGSLFLDEIGDMPLYLQAKLLRVLQEKVIMRLGGMYEIPVDVRIICATNKNIMSMVHEGTFRKDLFYRINTLILKIPPLAERRQDIIPISCQYLDGLNRKHGTNVGFQPEVFDKLEQNAWEGNVRELLHVIERAYVLCGGSDIQSEHIVFDSDILTPSVRDMTAFSEDEFEILQSVLIRNRYNKNKTAEELGISRATLWRKMKKYGL